MLVLVAAGSGALRFTLPLTLVITGMLALLVISYTQVIAAHPEGGGAYAVAKLNLGRIPALLAAASLFVDYVLTVAVSLAAGAASLGSVFPGLAHHLLLVGLIGLALLAAVNMFGIAESAKLLMLPAAVFIVSILAVIALGLFHPHPVATIGSSLGPIRPTTALGIVLILKAFASGCSAVTGVEAIANGVPAFRTPRVRTAQRTEVSLGVLLGVMLVGLAVLIRTHHVVPRGGVTVLAQLTAGAFGTGWPFYVSNLAVTLVLALAANTSFGGLPVLMSLLARDHRLPHLFYLRAERPVYRFGIVALALAASLLLIAVDAETARLIPLFTIGVFIGFTISQVGLVRHWHQTRPRRWQLRAAVNATGATMTAVAVVVFLDRLDPDPHPAEPDIRLGQGQQRARQAEDGEDARDVGGLRAIAGGGVGVERQFQGDLPQKPIGDGKMIADIFRRGARLPPAQRPLEDVEAAGNLFERTDQRAVFAHQISLETAFQPDFPGRRSIDQDLATARGAKKLHRAAGNCNGCPLQA